MQKMLYVFKTGDYTVIPVFINFVVMTSSLIWGLFAVLLHNVPLLVPQIAIVGICMITTVIYYVFKFKASKKAKVVSTQEVQVQTESEMVKKLDDMMFEAVQVRKFSRAEPVRRLSKADLATIQEPVRKLSKADLAVIRKQSIANEAPNGSLVVQIETRT